MTYKKIQCHTLDRGDDRTTLIFFFVAAIFAMCYAYKGRGEGAQNALHWGKLRLSESYNLSLCCIHFKYLHFASNLSKINGLRLK